MFGMTATPAKSHRSPVWWAALAVAVCSVIATSHGLFEVARTCGVAAPVAALYVPITDGLALVAYAATARLVRGRAYAWLVVVVAAGLSGLAQAVNLAGFGTVPVALRFGVGYWPAIAVAVAAHLLWLVSRPDHTPWPVPALLQPMRGPVLAADTRAPGMVVAAVEDPASPAAGPKVDQATTAAREWMTGHGGTPPTAKQLAEVTGIAQRTCGDALRRVRGTS